MGAFKPSRSKIGNRAAMQAMMAKKVIGAVADKLGMGETGPGGYKKGDFSTELPDCLKTELKEQLFACFCICFSLAQTGHRVNVLSFPAVICSFICVGVAVYVTSGLGFVFWAVISTYVRVKFREIYGINDGFNWFYDCCLSLWCNPCTLA